MLFRSENEVFAAKLLFLYVLFFIKIITLVFVLFCFVLLPQLREGIVKKKLIWMVIDIYFGMTQDQVNGVPSENWTSYQ